MSEQRARRDGVVATQRALNEIKAGDLLGDSLHPRIETQVRDPWRRGDYETAIDNAGRAIEIAVAERIPPPLHEGLCGVDAINAAFGTGNPLADPAHDPGEQESTRALFAGFVGTFGGHAGRPRFGRDGAEQPADIIRTADLLMRMLDDIAPAEPRPASHELAARGQSAGRARARRRAGPARQGGRP